MLWSRFIWLFIMFLLGRHLGFPNSPRYLELADSADFFIARENWNKAEATILKALRLEPANFGNSLLLANLGLVQANKGEYEKALHSLTLGLNLAPSSTVILNNRAHTYLLMDSIGPAINDLDKSLSIDSIQEWPLQTRAFLYLQDNRNNDASRLFNKLRITFPDNSSSFSGLAAISELQGRNEEAIKNYKKALELNPDDEDAIAAYIFLLIKTEDYIAARSEIREALNKNPENPMYYLLRGYLHRLNFRPDEALADKKTAIAKGLSPDYVSSFIP